MNLVCLYQEWAVQHRLYQDMPCGGIDMYATEATQASIDLFGCFI